MTANLLWHGCLVAVNDKKLSDIDRVAGLWLDCEICFSVNEGVLNCGVVALRCCTLIAIERCFGHKQVFHCLGHLVVNSLVGGILCCDSSLRLTP